MPIPVPQTAAQLSNTFLQTYVATLDPSFGVQLGNIPPGDPAIALGFATAAVGLQLQQGYMMLYAFARASTSNGSDLDSWFADFGYSRFQGTPATTTVNIPTSNGQAALGNINIPAGTVMQTTPLVLAPSTVPTVYSFITVGATVLIAGQTSVNVSVEAAANGSNYNNIPANTNLALGTGIAGVGNPTFNAAPQYGQDAASDAQARLDFIDWITSLSDGTLAAIVAAIQDQAGLVNGQNLAVLDFASSSGQVPRGYAEAVFISGGNTGQYTGSPYNAVANAAYSAMQETVALGITPLVYYANAYPIVIMAFTFTYSQGAITNAQLSLSQLETLMLQIVQNIFPATGGQLGQITYFSQIARAWLDLTYVNGSGVSIGGLVTDVNVPACSITTTGGFFSGDLIQAGSVSVRDRFGYISLALTNYPTWTAIAAA